MIQNRLQNLSEFERLTSLQTLFIIVRRRPLRWFGLQAPRLRLPRRVLGGVGRLGRRCSLGELFGHRHGGGAAVLPKVLPFQSCWTFHPSFRTFHHHQLGSGTWGTSHEKHVGAISQWFGGMCQWFLWRLQGLPWILGGRVEGFDQGSDLRGQLGPIGGAARQWWSDRDVCADCDHLMRAVQRGCDHNKDGAQVASSIYPSLVLFQRATLLAFFPTSKGSNMTRWSQLHQATWNW